MRHSMNHMRIGLRSGFLALLITALGMTATPVLSATVVPPAISGTVNAVGNDLTITVNGQRFSVVPGSAAANQLSTIHVGDTVGLVLNGPASSSASQVIGIVAGAVAQ